MQKLRAKVVDFALFPNVHYEVHTCRAVYFGDNMVTDHFVHRSVVAQSVGGWSCDPRGESSIHEDWILVSFDYNNAQSELVALYPLRIRIRVLLFSVGLLPLSLPLFQLSQPPEKRGVQRDLALEFCIFCQFPFGASS